MDRKKNEKKLLLLINPVSGKKAILRYLAQVIRIFMNAGYLVTTMVTAARGEAKTLAGQYGADFDLIVCAGGDGTMNETVSGLAAGGIRVPIGYIPCGSTNDFAASRGLSTDILQAAEAIAGGTPRGYDLGRFGERYFTYVAAFGAYSSISYSTDQTLKNMFGHAAYIVGGLLDPKQLRPTHMKLTVDGTIYEDDYLLGAVCNTTSIAGTLELPKDLVDTSDGMLELLLVKMPTTVVDLEGILSGLLSQDYTAPPLTLVRARSITAETEKPVEWALDGEASGAATRVSIEAVTDFFRLQS